MASKKLGNMIRDARTDAGLTQEALARKIAGLSASDISKAERGEKDLTQDQLKKIAKATGVTQASLLNAAKGTASTAKSASKSTTTKSASTKSTSTKSTSTKSTATKSTAAKSSSTKSSASTVSMRVTASEKKIVEAFREAEADQKKAALYILKGESKDLVDDILRKHGNEVDFGTILENVFGNLFGK